MNWKFLPVHGPPSRVNSETWHDSAQQASTSDRDSNIEHVESWKVTDVVVNLVSLVPSPPCSLSHCFLHHKWQGAGYGGLGTDLHLEWWKLGGGQGTRLEGNTLWEDANIGCVIFLSTSTMPPSYGPILHWMSPVQAAHPSRWGQNCRAEDHNHNSQSHSVHDDRNDQQSSHGGQMGAHIWEEGRDGRLVPVQ